jgi:uncharacterized metal-binding protein
LVSCNNEMFDCENIVADYHLFDNQQILTAAAKLVDNGKSGTLSRIQEIANFILSMKYQKVGLAYCYGMENDVKTVKQILKESGIPISSVACSVGGLAQDEFNNESCIHKVACNPIGQAKQLNAENIDFVVIIGICLGHDILLQRNLTCDFTTLVVKDRVFNHNPLLGIKLYYEPIEE